jgi:thiol-disulfide isomerase/thioredoxin
MRTSRTVLALVLALAAAPRLRAGEAAIRWRAIAEGEAESKKTGRPVLYFMTAEWCGPCHTMRKEVFADPAVAELVNRTYVPIEVVDRRREEGQNPPDEERIFTTYRCRGFPTLTITRPGSTQAFQAAGWLNRDATIDYLKIGGDRLKQLEKKGQKP